MQKASEIRSSRPDKVILRDPKLQVDRRMVPKILDGVAKQPIQLCTILYKYMP